MSFMPPACGRRSGNWGRASRFIQGKLSRASRISGRDWTRRRRSSVSRNRRSKSLDSRLQFAQRFRVPNGVPLFGGYPIRHHMNIRCRVRRRNISILLPSNKRTRIANSRNDECTREIARIVSFGWRCNIFSPPTQPSLEMRLQPTFRTSQA